MTRVMGFLRMAVDTARFVRAISYVRNVEWARLITRSRLDPSTVAYDRKTNRLTLRDFDLELTFHEHRFLMDGLQWAHLLRTKAAARFSIDDSHRLLCEIKGITIAVRTAEELFILHEIFVEGIYNIVFDRPAVVWDIGMNVGIASLYFATKNDVVVVSFEPFATTYKSALENLALNPHLRPRITAHNDGVGGTERIERVEYTPDHKGNMGIHGIPARLRNDRPTTIEEIRLKDARLVLNDIRRDHPNRPIIAKIDCEGSEYEILQALCDDQQLAHLDALMIEWHGLGDGPLLKLLNASGFVSFSFLHVHDRTGMIYAIRSATSGLVHDNPGRDMASAAVLMPDHLATASS